MRNIKEALFIRRVEEKLFDLFSLGKTQGTIHTCIGQEFSGLAFATSLVEGDLIFSNHRCHGHYISFTKDHKGLIAELMGKAAGICGGIGSSQHLCRGTFFSNGVQGGMVPVAAGAALANKLKVNGKVSLVFIGDGTLGEGVVYETMNIASLWKIPLVIVCENNFYAQSTHQSINLAGDILKRAEAFGIRTFRSNTWDPETLFINAKESIECARGIPGPIFHLVDTYRLFPHSKSDDNRNKEEIERYKSIDPINVFAKREPDVYRKMLSEIDAEVDASINELMNAPEFEIEKYHAPVVSTEGKSVYKPMEEIDARQVELINEFFTTQMGEDGSMVFLGEDVLSPYGGAFKVAKGLSDKYPSRVFSTPISEDAITGIANGLALSGFRPYLEIMFGDFIVLCLNQIINHASKFYHMYNKQVQCPVVIRTPMGGRRGYGATHSQTLDKFLVGIDNVTTIALNSLIDPRVIYSSIHKLEKHPVIVIENKTDYGRKIAKKRIRNFRYEVTDAPYPVARITPSGSKPDVTIVTYGGMADVVLDAIEPLFMELEVKAEVIVLSKIHPLDYSDIIDSVFVTRKLFVAEEGSAFAGIGSEIIASVAGSMGGVMSAHRIAALPVPIPSAKSLEDKVLPGPMDIIDTIRRSL